MGNTTIEVWKAIKGYEDYEISNYGNVSSNKTYRRKETLYMKVRDNGYGYLVVCLWKNNKRRNFYIHRLVANAFIDNPNSLPEVNHIDFNRHNNSVTNLEWVTRAENTNHSIGRGRHPRSLVFSSTGEKYIYRRKDRYRVAVYGCREKQCATLDEAITLRDSLVNKLGYQNYMKGNK
jgi:hypothetical protein